MTESSAITGALGGKIFTVVGLKQSMIYRYVITIWLCVLLDLAVEVGLGVRLGVRLREGLVVGLGVSDIARILRAVRVVGLVGVVGATRTIVV